MEDCEFELLKDLSKQYSEETIPIIIVYTKVIADEDSENAEKYISEQLNSDNNNFIPILAKEKKLKNGTIISPFGLDKLLEISIESAKRALKSSCYEGLYEDIKKKIKETLEKLMKQIKEKIDFKVQAIIS